MNGLRRYLREAVMIGSVLALSGCAVYPAHHHDPGYGPPPHAPAHGYRYKFHDHDLIYDAELGVYVVIGLHNHYYFDGYFYRYDHDHWYYSHDIDRDWRDYRNGKLPPGLAKKHGHGTKRKGY